MVRRESLACCKNKDLAQFTLLPKIIRIYYTVTTDILAHVISSFIMELSFGSVLQLHITMSRRSNATIQISGGSPSVGIYLNPPFMQPPSHRNYKNYQYYTKSQ